MARTPKQEPTEVDFAQTAKHAAAADTQASKKSPVVTAMLIALLVGLLCGVAGGVWYVFTALASEHQAVQTLEERSTPATPEELAKPEVATSEPTATPAEQAATEPEAKPEPELVDNPVDFAALNETSPDAYAWLYIPNTMINVPILQHPDDDAFYLDHTETGDYNVYGSIFTELANNKDFSDPVTLIYGHNGEAQLRNLHYFEDPEFFAENDAMYVYTPGHILTYKIVAAYRYDNRHILNAFDFSNPEVLQEYFDYVTNPDSLLVNVRTGSLDAPEEQPAEDGTAPAAEEASPEGEADVVAAVAEEPVHLDATTDKIIQLSTCMLDEFHGNSRYIVTGVLVDDQPTR